MRFVVSFASLDRAKLGQNARPRRGAVLRQALRAALFAIGEIGVERVGDRETAVSGLDMAGKQPRLPRKELARLFLGL